MIQHAQVFGKPKTPDGRVLERALSARSTKSGKAYREVVKLIIRPPRAEYDVKKLGPTPFTYVTRFRGGKQTIMRSDFAVVNQRQDVELKCSQWKPVGAHLDQLPCVLYLHGNASCRVEALQVLKIVLELGCTLCSVWKSNFGRPTPSTRRCRQDGQPNSLVDFHTGCAASTSLVQDSRRASSCRWVTSRSSMRRRCCMS